MPNSIDKVSLYQKVLDEQLQAGLRSSVLEMNPLLVRYIGGNTMMIPDIETEGLVDFSRTDGYGTAGGTTLNYKPYTFDMERSFNIAIDRNDAEESGLDNLAMLALSSTQKDHAIPEIDAYRFSKIYSEANTAGNLGLYVPAEGTIFETLKTDIATVRDKIGSDTDLMIFMSEMTANTLDNADKIEKQLGVSDFNGNISTAVRALDGVPIIKVPSLRFKNAYTFKAGGVAGRGFEAKAGALSLNWLIVAKPSVTAIVKLSNMKMFTPDQDQIADSWVVKGRNLHTLFVPARKVDGIYASITPANSVVPSALTLLTGNNTITVTLTGGAFKSTVTMDNLSVAGTDKTAIEAGTITRVSDTVITITIATGNTGTNNVITILGSAQELQATSVATVASTV